MTEKKSPPKKSSVMHHEVPRLGIDKIPGMEHYGIHPAKASIAGHEPVNDFIIMGGKNSRLCSYWVSLAFRKLLLKIFFDPVHEILAANEVISRSCKNLGTI